MSALARFLGRRVGARAIPWITWYQAARTVATRAHAGWNHLTPAERDELQRIVRSSGGRPWAVPERQRPRLRALVFKAMRGAAFPGR